MRALFPEQLEVVRPTGSENVYFRCSEHNYWGSLTPPMAVGCKACWAAYYMIFLGKYHTKDGEDEVLRAVMRNAAEAADKGKYDVQLYEHPRIRIDKEDVN